jgi:hypothetical protein
MSTATSIDTTIIIMLQGIGMDIGMGMALGTIIDTESMAIIMVM